MALKQTIENSKNAPGVRTICDVDWRPVFSPQANEEVRKFWHFGNSLLNNGCSGYLTKCVMNIKSAEVMGEIRHDFVKLFRFLMKSTS